MMVTPWSILPGFLIKLKVLQDLKLNISKTQLCILHQPASVWVSSTIMNGVSLHPDCPCQKWVSPLHAFHCSLSRLLYHQIWPLLSPLWLPNPNSCIISTPSLPISSASLLLSLVLLIYGFSQNYSSPSILSNTQYCHNHLLNDL